MRILLALAAAVLSAHGAPAPVSAHQSQYGRVLFDSRGFALYLFTADRAGKRTCFGACAKAWPPYLAGGRQVVFKGHPLYHYVGDTKPGQILCQNVREYGGLWLVVQPDGTPVR
jgi:predicted lipoprotein with Yx(FWY)xxD motif